MAKLYIHTPVLQLLTDLTDNLDESLSSPNLTLKNLKLDFTALIVSPVDDARGFKQIFPLFLNKLTKKFTAKLRKNKIVTQIKFTWDENMTLVLESLENFLNLKWKVKFRRSEENLGEFIDDFKVPMASLGITEDVYVEFELLTSKKDNSFEFNEVNEALQDTKKFDLSPEGEEDNGELVVEEIDRENTEKDKEEERKLREAEAKRADEEFTNLQTKLNEEFQNMNDFMKKGKLGVAKTIAETILESISLVKSNKREHSIYLAEKRIEASIVLASIFLENGNGLQAKKILSKLVSIAKKGPVDFYFKLLSLLGDAEFILEDYEEAMKAYSLCLSLERTFKKEEKMLLNGKRAETAIKFELDDGIGYVNMTAEEGLKYMKYVVEQTKPGDPLHSYAAHSVAEFLFKRGQIGNAAHINLVALISDSTNPELRKQFAMFLKQHEQLVSAILDMFTNIKNGNTDVSVSAATNANSISFLGGILKEHSVIKVAEVFIAKSCSITNYQEPQYVLNLLHIYELKNDFPAFGNAVIKYLESSPTDGVSVELQDLEGSVTEVITKIKADNNLKQFIKDEGNETKLIITNEFFKNIFSAAKNVIDTHVSQFHINVSASNIETKLVENESLIKVEEETETSTKKPFDHMDQIQRKYSIILSNDTPTLLSELCIEISKSKKYNSKTLDEKSLSILGIYFTCLKFLFRINPVPQTEFARTHGKDVIPNLLEIINYLEPIRLLAKDLHSTLIRNEQAYYSLVCQVLPYILKQRKEIGAKLIQLAGTESSKPLFSTKLEDELKVVYVFGESHCIPLSWCLSTLNGVNNLKEVSEITQFYPILATGVKAWHLREDSCFYPKYAFYENLKYLDRHFRRLLFRRKIPAEKRENMRAPVIFIFGEIDCREGMPLAVQRAKYDSVEDAIEAVINIYCNVLEEIIKKYKLQIYVHPVLPVMEVTRVLVQKYNEVLEAKIKTLENKTKGIIKWLDILPSLLGSDGKVKPEFELDGTHVNPIYADLFKGKI